METVGSLGAAVRFVDYGNVETVRFSKIRPIKPEFLQLPAQAIHCQLFCGKSSYTRDESDAVFNRLDGRKLQIEFVDRKNGIYEVLIKEITKDWLVSDYINACVTNGVDLNSARNKAVIDVDKLRSINCLSLDSDNWSGEDWENETAEMPDTPTPSFACEISSMDVDVGAVKNGKIVHYDDPSSFVLQVNNDEFRALQERINGTYKKIFEVSSLPKRCQTFFVPFHSEFLLIKFIFFPLQPLPVCRIVPGLVCVAKYCHDQRWCRAVVESITDFGVIVRFIDYGKIAVVSPSKIQEIKPEFFVLPAQAIHCQLFGCKSSFTSSESDIFFTRFVGRDLKFEFLERLNGKYQVLVTEIKSNLMDSDYINNDALNSEVDLTSGHNVILMKSKNSSKESLTRSDYSSGYDEDWEDDQLDSESQKNTRLFKDGSCFEASRQYSSNLVKVPCHCN